MKLIKKFLILISFILVLTFGLTKSVHAESWTQDKNGNWICTTGYEPKLSSTYYSLCDGKDTETSLRQALHKILTTGITKISYGGGSNETRYALEYCDEYPTDTSCVFSLYSNFKISKNSYGSSVGEWNQEHTWAKSHGFSTKSYYAHCDINHLRACDMQLNSTRSSSNFTDLSDSAENNKSKHSDWPCYWSGNAFEPSDNIKGDVARIMMYMDVRYEGDSTYDNSVDLKLVNYQVGGGAEFGVLSTLIKWHEEDPVDDYERRRNDRVEECQGNRNPFIDHPEYANIIFGANYDDGKGYKVSYNANGGSFNYNDTNKYESGAKISAPSVNPIKQGYDFVGWYKDSSLTIKFDFNKDTITSNMTLYAKYTYNPALKDLVELTKIYKSLSLSYKKTGSSSSISNTITLSPTSGNTTNDSEKNATLNINEYFTYDNSLFDIDVNYCNNPYFYIISGQFRLYNAGKDGTEIVLSPKDDLIFTDCTCVSTDSSNIEVTVLPNKVTIKNVSAETRGRIDVTSFTVSYQKGTSSYEIKDASCSILVKIDETFYNKIKDLDYALYINSTPINATFVKNGEYYELKASSLSLLNNKTYTVVFRVSDEKNTYEATTYTISLKTLSKAYIDSGNYNSILELLNYVYIK